MKDSFSGSYRNDILFSIEACLSIFQSFKSVADVVDPWIIC